VPADTSLDAGETTTVKVELKVPADWPDTNKGKTGTVKLTVEGKSS
jgi:hypothetical protein